MEYELGKLLDRLEAQNGYLARVLTEMQAQIKELDAKNRKILAILEKAVEDDSNGDNDKENPSENTNSGEQEPLDRSDNIGGTIPVKRGRGRPRKSETPAEQPSI